MARRRSAFTEPTSPRIGHLYGQLEEVIEAAWQRGELDWDISEYHLCMSSLFSERFNDDPAFAAMRVEGEARLREEIRAEMIARG